MYSQVNSYLLLQICSNSLGCVSNLWNSGNRTQTLEFGLQKSWIRVKNHEKKMQINNKPKDTSWTAFYFTVQFLKHGGLAFPVAQVLAIHFVSS